MNWKLSRIGFWLAILLMVVASVFGVKREWRYATAQPKRCHLVGTFVGLGSERNQDYVLLIRKGAVVHINLTPTEAWDIRNYKPGELIAVEFLCKDSR